MLKQEEAGLPPLSFEMRMVILYRVEKKKIIRSQLNIVDKMIEVLKNCEEILTNEDKEAAAADYT